MSTALRLVLLVVLVTAASCASAPAAPPPVAPGQVAELEATVRRDPTDLDAILLLARGYAEMDRASASVALVRRARARLPEEASLAFLEGLYAQEAGAYSDARAAYEAFLATRPGGQLGEEAEARLVRVRRDELRASLRAALAREGELAQTTPDPRAVGVFPFVQESEDEEWAPLGVALAELLTTDLGVTGRLRVLERVRVQALLGEMALAETGLVDSRTAARSGRILGAGQLVQGRFRVRGGERIGVEAAVVQVGAPGELNVAPVIGDDELEGLFRLEKQMALDLHAEMGIQLTPAARERVTERHTESIQALLAFGRGLVAADAGDFETARARFEEATDVDPGFALARAGASAAAAAVVAMPSSVQLQAAAQRLIQQEAAIRALRNAPASIRQRVLSRLTVQQRAALAEALGQDRLGASIPLELIFVRPGGTP